MKKRILHRFKVSEAQYEPREDRGTNLKALQINSITHHVRRTISYRPDRYSPDILNHGVYELQDSYGHVKIAVIADMLFEEHTAFWIQGLAPTLELALEQARKEKNKSDGLLFSALYSKR